MVGVGTVMAIAFDRSLAQPVTSSHSALDRALGHGAITSVTRTAAPGELDLARMRTLITEAVAAGDGHLARLFRAAAFHSLQDTVPGPGLAAALEREASRGLTEFRRTADPRWDDGAFESALTAALARTSHAAAAAVDLVRRVRAGEELGVVESRAVDLLAHFCEPLSASELDTLAEQDPVDTLPVLTLPVVRDDRDLDRAVRLAAWDGVRAACGVREPGALAPVMSITETVLRAACEWLLDGERPAEVRVLAQQEAFRMGTALPALLDERGLDWRIHSSGTAVH